MFDYVPFDIYIIIVIIMIGAYGGDLKVVFLGLGFWVSHLIHPPLLVLLFSTIFLPFQFAVEMCLCCCHLHIPCYCLSVRVL